MIRQQLTHFGSTKAYLYSNTRPNEFMTKEVKVLCVAGSKHDIVNGPESSESRMIHSSDDVVGLHQCNNLPTS